MNLVFLLTLKIIKNNIDFKKFQIFSKGSRAHSPIQIFQKILISKFKFYFKIILSFFHFLKFKNVIKILFGN